MATIPDEFIEELKQRNNIVSIVSRYITLDKKGRNYWGRCPFHLEKTPSFSVNEIDQYYHCFGCKAGGNIFSFVMNMESVSFYDAVKMIAEWSGMQVPETTKNNIDYEQQKKDREVMVACMRECAKHYHENLKNSQVAQEYLKNRKISNEMITKFGIGYSSSYTEIIEYMQSKGYSKELLFKVGIIKEKEGRYYDAIGERIAFPVINIYGEVVAFSGRTLKQKVDFAKYINTADTPLYSKSKNLFAVNLVKKAKQEGKLKEIIILEGQTDVIALHQAGYHGALASLGTALTVDQARLIKRLCENVIICYDGDFAGTKATMRGLDILKHEQLNVKVASLPDGKDPDELIRERGKDAFDKVIENSLPLIEYKLKVLKEKYDLKSFDGKAKYVDEAIDVLTDLEDVEAEVYIEYISNATGVYKDFLRKKLQDKNLKLSENNVVNTASVKREVQKDDMLTKAQMCVFANILRRKEYIKDLKKLQSLFDGKFKEIAEFLVENNDIQEFIKKFQYLDNIVGEVVNYNFIEDEGENEKIFLDCVWYIKKSQLLEEQQVLNEKLSKVYNSEEKKQLFKRLMEISQQINNRRFDL